MSAPAELLTLLSDDELRFSVENLTRIAKVLGKRLRAHPVTRAQLDAALGEQMARTRQRK